MNAYLAYALGTAACLVALACGHESSSPSSSSPLHVPVPVPDLVSSSSPAPAPAPPVTGIAPGPSLPLEPAPAPIASPATRCIQVDDELGGTRVELEGRVFVDPDFAHPSRGKTRPFILHLDAPRCALGTDETRIVEVHLAASEDIALRPLVGKHVRVSGDPFAAHTAWHARPIVLMATRIAAVP